MNILIAEPENYSHTAIEMYATVGNVVQLPDLNVPLEAVIAHFEVVVLRLGYVIDKGMLQKASKLRYIISPTTGLDHIDEVAAAEKGISIISLRGEASFLSAIPSTAEFTWTLLLALLKRLPDAVQHVIEGGWNRNLYKGNNVKGKKIGILGLGRVGKQVGGYALAFGMEVMAYDTDPSQLMSGIKMAATPEELFSWSQILCIHIPALNNDGYISANLLQLLSLGAFVINTSRGSVWDEAAVATLLQNHHLGGVATDVLGGEMNEVTRKSNPLLSIAGKLPNLIITPHIAGATFESMAATEDFVSRKFMAIVSK
ncbi:MAG: NAD(P)-dependent oxidoreductase [Chitinophagaceae bacterium]